MEEPIITEEDFDIDFDDELEPGTYLVSVASEEDDFYYEVGTFTDAADATYTADALFTGISSVKLAVPGYVDRVVITVEVMVEVDGEAQPAGVIFRKTLSIK